MQLSNSTYQFDNEVGWKMATNEFFASFFVKTSADAQAWMLRIHEISLRLYVTTDQYLNVDSELYAECEGIMIGTTIDSRLGSGSDPTDTATSAGHQAEQILSLYFGFLQSHVNFSAIDESQIALLKTRGIIDERESQSLGQILQALSENSNILAFIDERSRLSVIDLVGAAGTPTVIPFQHLAAPPTVFRSDQKQLCNYLKMSYDYDPIGHKFAAVVPIQHAASQAIHGIIERAVRLQMLDPASASVYSIITMTGSETVTPFLSIRHNGIIVPTLGWHYLHLDIGDWIQLDASTDPHLLFNGATWAGESFLILGKEAIDRERVEFTAIQLT
jgi:hypothetical protein